MQSDLLDNITPLNAERIITLNCGLGRDSICMLMLCFEGKLWAEGLGNIRPRDLDVVVFSDTGNEWPFTEALIPKIKRLCDEHGVRFLVLNKGDGERNDEPGSWADIEAQAETGGYHYRPALMDDFQSRATVASLGKGDCTDNHKIQPIRRLINDISVVRFGLNNRQWAHPSRAGENDPHVTLIGIAADETSRLHNGAGGPAYVTEAYPLVDMGIAKPDEVSHLKRWQLNHVRKSGCFMCPYQPADWWWALSVREPELYERAVEYERVALERNPRMAATGFRVKGDPITIPEVVERWRAANPDATVTAVLDKTYSRCTKQVKKQQRAALN